jgi:hypothetical protein
MVPSTIANNAPANHAMIACGPCMDWITIGSTMNGPIPTMSIIFNAVASLKLRDRIKPCEVEVEFMGSDQNSILQLESVQITKDPRLHV